MNNPHKGNRGMMRAWRAAQISWGGFSAAFREESAFRQEFMLAAVLIPLALLLPFTAIERLLLIGSVLIVLMVELVNCAIEATVDRISFDYHELAKRAKDYGSAAVTVALLVCSMVWITLLWVQLGRW